MKQNIIKIWFVLMVAVIFVYCPLTVWAGEITIMKLVTAKGEAEAKTKPDEGAPTAITYAEGDTIAVIEEVDRRWYAVGYQGEVYYVQKSQTRETGDAVVQEELNQELVDEAEEGRKFVEEVERQRSEVRNRRIWGIIIGLLAVEIVAVRTLSWLQKKNR